MKIKINFKKALNILLISSMTIFILFILLVMLQNQISNIDFLNRFGNVLTFKKVDNFQDILVVIGMLPKSIIIILLLFLLKRLENRNKNTSGSNIVQLIFSVIFTYFVYVNLFSNSFFTKYVSNVFLSYQLINILFFILFVFGIIYSLNKVYALFNIIRQKSIKEALTNYEVYFYPIIIIMFIYLTVNLANIMALKYIVYKLVSIVSLQSFIDISSILNLPLDANLSQILPPFIIDFLNNFNVNLNLSISDLNINVNFINKIFDNVILSRIDNAIDKFITDKIDSLFFTNLYNFIFLFILNVSIIVLEVFKKYNKEINFIILIIMSVLYLNIGSVLSNLLAVVTIVLVIVFGYIIAKENSKIIIYYKEKYINVINK